MQSDRAFFGAAWRRAINEGLIVDATQFESGFGGQEPGGVLVAAVSTPLYEQLDKKSRTRQEMSEHLRRVVRRATQILADAREAWFWVQTGGTTVHLHVIKNSDGIVIGLSNW
jgi:hypothetical protein